jgi:hypothetical protein
MAQPPAGAIVVAIEAKGAPRVTVDGAGERFRQRPRRALWARLRRAAPVLAALAWPGHVSAEDCVRDSAGPVSPAQAGALLDCLGPAFDSILGMSGLAGVETLLRWPRYAAHPYLSADHGGRYVMPLANAAASAFGRFQRVGRMPDGATLALVSFTVADDGRALPGPVYLMEKMEPGFAPALADWRYRMILPDGASFQTTSTPQRDALRFCAGCHGDKGRGTDAMIYPPQELRPAP